LAKANPRTPPGWCRTYASGHCAFASGRAAAVADLRRTFQETMKLEFTTVVEEATDSALDRGD
jgi:hypothetical protein